MQLDGGAINDLAENSSALGHQSTFLPLHTIIGVASPEQNDVYSQGLITGVEAYCTTEDDPVCDDIFPQTTFSEIFGESHDIIVPASSQRAGLPENDPATTNSERDLVEVENLIHSTALYSVHGAQDRSTLQESELESDPVAREVLGLLNAFFIPIPQIEGQPFTFLRFR